MIIAARFCSLLGWGAAAGMPTFRPDERDLTSVEPHRHQSLIGRQTPGEPTRPTTYQTLRTCNQQRLAPHIQVGASNALQARLLTRRDTCVWCLTWCLTARIGLDRTPLDGHRARQNTSSVHMPTPAGQISAGLLFRRFWVRLPGGALHSGQLSGTFLAGDLLAVKVHPI